MAGTPCRPSINPCDLPEYCGGASPFCPADFYMIDGLPCANNAAFCFEGRCQTFDYQCKQLFGSGTSHCSHFLSLYTGWSYVTFCLLERGQPLNDMLWFQIIYKACFVCLNSCSFFFLFISGFSEATKADDKCFSNVNTLGNVFGNCGYSGSNPKPCEVQWVPHFIFISQSMHVLHY